jgi:hypothetical protein
MSRHGLGLIYSIPAVRTDIRFGISGHLKSFYAVIKFLGGFKWRSGLGIEACYGLGITHIGTQKISLMNSHLTKFHQHHCIF